jgi:hypothetical protein
VITTIMRLSLHMLGLMLSLLRRMTQLILGRPWAPRRLRPTRPLSSDLAHVTRSIDSPDVSGGACSTCA